MKKSAKLPSTAIAKAATIIENGGIVIFPTDTVWGIGCLYDNPKSVNKIYKIKNSPSNQPFPILVSNLAQVRKLAKITPNAQKLIKKYWPGGLTIIMNSMDGQKVGLRLPRSKIVLQLIKQVGSPIIGTSANFHGQKAVKSFKDLDPQLVKLADFTIQGECDLGVESTVVDATTDPPKILRQGAIRPFDQLRVVPSPVEGRLGSG